MGLVLYEMATGRCAFAASTAAIIFEGILNRYPPPISQSNPQTPAELERIIGKLLVKDRSLRYRTASDLAADLNARILPDRGWRKRLIAAVRLQ